MKVTKWMRKKAVNRLIHVENLNISKRERKIKRTAMWITLDFLIWTLVITGLPGETIVIENAYARGNPESAIDTRTIVDKEEDGTGVDKEDGESVESLIRRAFPDNPEMIAIAKCESQLRNDRVGDMGIRFEKDGKMWGSSHGIFQIRNLPGRSEDPDKFAEDMKDPKKNIEQAKRIFESQGHAAWYNCSVKEGIL